MRARGVALVAVLWGLVILAVLAAGITAVVRTESRRQGIAGDQVRRDAFLASAETEIVHRLYVPGSGRKEVLSGAPIVLADDGLRASVRVTNEAGRIDINAASDEVLDALARSIGLNEEQSRAWIARLRDWQDPDDERLAFGAEEADYRAKGLRYGPRNGNLRSIDELRIVLGMTDALYRCLEPAITVYTGASIPNPAELTATSKLAWSRYLSAKSLEPQVAQEVVADELPAGQVLRLDIEISPTDGKETHTIVVGRITGDLVKPWIAIARRPGIAASETMSTDACAIGYE